MWDSESEPLNKQAFICIIDFNSRQMLDNSVAEILITGDWRMGSTHYWRAQWLENGGQPSTVAAETSNEPPTAPDHDGAKAQGSPIPFRKAPPALSLLHQAGIKNSLTPQASICL